MILICMGHKVVTWNNNNASVSTISIGWCNIFLHRGVFPSRAYLGETTSWRVHEQGNSNSTACLYAWVSPVFEANFHSFGEFKRARLLFSWLREKVDYAGNKITCVHSHPRVAALLKFPRRLLRLSPAASSLAVSPLCNFFSPSRCVFLIWSRGTKSSYARGEHCWKAVLASLFALSLLNQRAACAFALLYILRFLYFRPSGGARAWVGFLRRSRNVVNSISLHN